MNTTQLLDRIKNYRNQKGLSQEELAEKTGLSLRAIQRIENEESIPRGDSLQRLATVLEMNIEDLTEKKFTEDSKEPLFAMNLGAFSFLLFPFLGFLIPLILWKSKKNKSEVINQSAKNLLNFQLTWFIALLILAFIHILILAHQLGEFAASYDVSPTLIAGAIKQELTGLQVYTGIFYLYNITLILFNIRRIRQNKPTNYFPAIRFMKEN